MMALWVRKSRDFMINRFKSKMGSLGLIHFSSCSSSFTRKSPVLVPFPASFAQNHRIPEGEFGNPPAHFRFCSRRFESGKAETLYDEGDANQV
ncbi:hypothetical protein RchiOBHm_Chr2g0121691 [Rosa chinensis]|uniref:Uncharacterized protein n=2 Tax=Rosa chinensis TaxID=74649 RepID=A0A2P6RSK3_ROSCH|nr:hypothetical protein RchiOBHm_Chr2g0121691 [Rosa chinensis]